MRRLVAVLSSCAVAAGVLVGVAVPASAATASPASVSMDYSGGSYALSADEVSGGAGDTFTFTNNVNQTLYLRNAAGSIRVGATTCTSTDCPVSDSGGSVTVTIVSTGVIQVVGSSTWTITLVGGDASTSSPTDPALVYPTLYLNVNGGTCSGPTQFTKYRGENGRVTLPMGDSCTRDGYELKGWGADVWTPGVDDSVFMVFPPGWTVPIGPESFTVDAIWAPNGIEITYDANVGANDDCLVSGVNTDVRTSTLVVAVGSATATSAPCTPAGMVLAGWSLDGNAVVARTLGESLPPSWVSGSSHRLYAKWTVTYGVSISPATQVGAVNQPASVTISATRNGAPAAGATVLYRWTGIDAFGNFDVGSTSATTGADGTVTVTTGWTFDPSVSATITAAYGDQTATATATGKAPVTKSISVTGERMTVSGKPGIRVEGVTTGFAAGERVVPYFRFPGQTEYSQGSARPVVDADGEFFWERKTGKKMYVFFTSEDGSVTSDRIIIQAK